MEKIIGTNSLRYPEIRNFAYPENKYVYKEERDLFSTLLNQYFRFSKKIHPVLQYLFLRPWKSNVSFRHFFNTISFNKMPWVVTFETTLPRLGNVPNSVYDLAINQLVSDNCKKIIALSQCTYDSQAEYVKNNYPQFEKLLTKKMIVLHPPQRSLINDYGEKQLSDHRIVFTLIGGDFFRKGGREILNVFNTLLPIYPHMELKIVSSMLFGDYASQTTEEDYVKAMRIINKYPENIEHYYNLPNEQVLELFKNTHIGLLPTWGDTYGYSVLEAQAAGCPTITTNLRALPEINNNDVGWIIDVPKLKNGNGQIETPAERDVFQNVIEKRLKEIIVSVIENPEIVKKKGIAALQRIKDEHNIENHYRVLQKVYTEMLS
ncbi:glycosyltransferase family 4 protein [Sulfurovum sp.]|uniref:glycosyltransferase family 4 protein n=1 Tax=Sulfurovum sp. TaxID=1969726 RepID=UPI00356918CF